MENNALLLGHSGLGDQIHYVGMVRYLRTKHDKLLLLVLDNYSYKNVKQMYSDDDSIEIYRVKDYTKLFPHYGGNVNFFNHLFKGYKQYLLGFHKYGRGYCGMVDLPFCFYDDVDISRGVFWDHFKVSIPGKSKDLYNIIKNKYQYIFIHNTSSSGIVYEDSIVENKLNINKNDVVYVNPCVNMYEKGHKYYDLCENLKDHLLLDYVDIIENADAVILSDSSFLCLAIHLKIKTEKCYYCLRPGNDIYDLDNLWNDRYKSSNTYHRKFINLNNTI